MSILLSAQKRYATKAFDSKKSIPQQSIDTLKQIIRLSPSSINIQPWHFIVVTSDQGKAKIAEACPGSFAYNAKKIKESSLVIIFCAKNVVNTENVKQIIEQEDKDGRYADNKAKQDRETLLTNYINNLNQDPIRAKAWIDKQTYIALGNVLLAAADMGIDSVPIEGYHPEILDESFQLTKKGLHSTVIAAFGYHSDTDFNAKLPKSRLPNNLLFTEV